MDFHVIHSDICTKCKCNYNIYVPIKCCQNCSDEDKSTDKLEKVQAVLREVKLKKIWHDRKKFAIKTLLFLPIIWFVGLKFGFEFELLVIAGYIYCICENTIIDLIMKFY